MVAGCYVLFALPTFCSPYAGWRMAWTVGAAWRRRSRITQRWRNRASARFQRRTPYRAPSARSSARGASARINIISSATRASSSGNDGACAYARRHASLLLNGRWRVARCDAIAAWQKWQ